jgi:hypothetical protein
MKMNISKLRELENNVPADIVIAVGTYFNAVAFVEALRPVSDRIRAKALEIFQPTRVPFGIKELDVNVGELIERWESLYTTSPELSSKIYAYHRAEMKKAGFIADGDQCAFLVAEHLVTEATCCLFDLAMPVTDIDPQSLFLIEQRDKYLKLILGLLVPLCLKQGHEIKELS